MSDPSLKGKQSQKVDRSAKYTAKYYAAHEDLIKFFYGCSFVIVYFDFSSDFRKIAFETSTNQSRGSYILTIRGLKTTLCVLRTCVWVSICVKYLLQHFGTKRGDLKQFVVS